MHLYLTEMGIINSLGTGKAEIRARLLSTDQSRLRSYGPLLTGRATTVARVHESLMKLPRAFAEFDCRNNQLLAAALDQISPSVARLRDEIGAERIAVVIGTSTSGIAAGEEAIANLAAKGRLPEKFHYRQQEIGMPGEFAARYLELEGLRYTISTACSSSAKAFASARRLLQAGLCDAVIVGGADSLCALTLNGFDSLESLATGICNPFSENRCGINIGEGACVFLLTKIPGPVRLCGVGESSDGYHMSAPDPDGRGAEIAMLAALREAGVAPSDIGYINLHGTATPKNDEMESRVIARLFGLEVPCGSTKALIGHTLGAAGAQELGLCWLLLTDDARRLPRHVWDNVRDPQLPPINLIDGGVSFERDCFASNSFAFGGSNTTVVIGRA